MSECLCQGASFDACDNTARRQWLTIATVGVGGALGATAITPGDAALGADWPGGFLCPCHGSTFDFAGRVFKNKPAPTNLEVPPYRFLSDSRLIIGSDELAPT